MARRVGAEYNPPMEHMERDLDPGDFDDPVVDLGDDDFDGASSGAAEDAAYAEDSDDDED